MRRGRRGAGYNSSSTSITSAMWPTESAPRCFFLFVACSSSSSSTWPLVFHARPCLSTQSPQSASPSHSGQRWVATGLGSSSHTSQSTATASGSILLPTPGAAVADVADDGAGLCLGSGDAAVRGMTLRTDEKLCSTAGGGGGGGGGGTPSLCRRRRPRPLFCRFARRHWRAQEWGQPQRPPPPLGAAPAQGGGECGLDGVLGGCKVGALRRGRWRWRGRARAQGRWRGGRGCLCCLPDFVNLQQQAF
jgi:hypothetical protein